MTERLQPAEFLDVRRLRLVEVAAPEPSPDHQAAMDRVWDEAVGKNPALFDGLVAACAEAEQDGPHGLVLRWASVTYRHYALRWVPGAAALPSLFVAVVQPAEEGGLLVQMSSPTTAPGRWQLPGGSVEPPGAGGRLDEAALRENAARELPEEVGVVTGPEDLALWAVTCGEHGNIGVFFRAVPRSAAVLGERFAALSSAELSQGRDPELTWIVLVRSSAEAADLPGLHAGYLQPVVSRYVEEHPRHRR